MIISFLFIIIISLGKLVPVVIDKENYGFQRNRKQLGKQLYNSISFIYKP